MIVFQWIMLPILAVLTGIFFRRLKGQPLLRLVVLMVMAAAMFFLLFPDMSTLIASYLGIGRGVDVIIYLSLLGLTLVSIMLYLRMLGLQKQIEELVRKDAIEDASSPQDMSK